jgi:serine/threonine protein phosphatase 1
VKSRINSDVENELINKPPLFIKYLKMKRFVIGDIHGGYLGLLQCLELSNFDYENDMLIQIGDICDGWSQTWEVIKELSKIKNFILIKGNHDQWALEYLDNQSFGSLSWLEHGGKSTLSNYNSLDVDGKEFFKNFLNSAKPYYIDSDNNLFLHAGYSILESINDIHYRLDMEISSGNLWWDRKFWNKSFSGDYPTDSKYNNIFIGHTPTINYGSSKPIRVNNIWNVDTGAAFFGPISIMNIDTFQYFQSEYIFKLYPDERGRNTTSYNNMIKSDWKKHLIKYDIYI